MSSEYLSTEMHFLHDFVTRLMSMPKVSFHSSLSVLVFAVFRVSELNINISGIMVIIDVFKQLWML